MTLKESFFGQKFVALKFETCEKKSPKYPSAGPTEFYSIADACRHNKTFRHVETLYQAGLLLVGGM